jgi:hypothetical protein
MTGAREWRGIGDHDAAFTSGAALSHNPLSPAATPYVNLRLGKPDAASPGPYRQKTVTRTRPALMPHTRKHFTP